MHFHPRHQKITYDIMILVQSCSRANSVPASILDSGALAPGWGDVQAIPGLDRKFSMRDITLKVRQINLEQEFSNAMTLQVYYGI